MSSLVAHTINYSTLVGLNGDRTNESGFSDDKDFVGVKVWKQMTTRNEPAKANYYITWKVGKGKGQRVLQLKAPQQFWATTHSNKDLEVNKRNDKMEVVEYNLGKIDCSHRRLLEEIALEVTFQDPTNSLAWIQATLELCISRRICPNTSTVEDVQKELEFRSMNVRHRYRS
jgi:hypothetical protein